MGNLLYVFLRIISNLFGLGLVMSTRLFCHGTPKKPKLGRHFTTFHLSSTDMDKDFSLYPSFFSLQNNSFGPTQYGLSLLFAVHPMMSMILIYISIELSEWLICWIFHSELSADWVSPESSYRSHVIQTASWARLKQLESAHDTISWYIKVIYYCGMVFLSSSLHVTRQWAPSSGLKSHLILYSSLHKVDFVFATFIKILGIKYQYLVSLYWCNIAHSKYRDMTLYQPL